MSMCITKFYRKRLAILAILVICFALSFLNSLFQDIPDASLDALALELHKASDFNPRRMTHYLFSYIQSKIHGSQNQNQPVWVFDHSDGIEFHWDDWVDLSAGNSHLNKARRGHPEGECDASLVQYSMVNPYFMESHNTKVSRGMAYLYCSKSVPKRVLAATDYGYFEVPVKKKRRMGEKTIQVRKQEVVDLMSKTQPTKSESSETSAIKFTKYAPFRKNIDVSPQDFVFDLDKEILTLKEKMINKETSTQDEEHLRFLEYSNSIVDSADRFFKYPWIYSDLVAGRSHHMSFPFFKRYISSRERSSVIQHMIKAWFKFSETYGAVTWVNYGSLLGWAYNGVNMPWDTDVDIQIPISQLDKLSKAFNNTLVVENPRDGNAKYLFEVSPTYTRHGNGRNFIDARFIEINSGLYIDISVLSHTNDQPPKELMSPLSEKQKQVAMPVHCKNWNWHLLDELLPIRHSYFENSSVYIPRNISSILSRKYGKDSFTTKLQFNGYHFDHDLMLWIPDTEDSKKCKVESNSLEFASLSPNCRSSWIKDEYKIVHDAAQRHKILDKNIDLPMDYDIDLISDLPLTRKDAWDYFDDLSHKKVTNTNWFTGH